MPAKSNTIELNAVSKSPSARKTRSTEKKSNNATSGLTISPRTRATQSHIFFWGGILSNWCLDSPAFLGTEALEIMLPKFDALHITYPDPNAVSSRLLAAHEFICGEQWMMAVKAWLFERSHPLGERLVDLNIEDSDGSTHAVLGRKEFDAIRHNVMQATRPQEASDLYEGTLCAILTTPEPRQQKALGRNVQGFDDATWTRASTAVVVAGCIARAEADPALRQIYQEGITRRFVEGSPVDRIWGVGLKWDNLAINNERNWRGENRLGKCHDEAAKYIRQGLNQV